MEGDPAVAVWWGSRAEVASALSRMTRDGRLSLKDCDAALAGAAELIRDALVIEPDARLLDGCIGLLRRRALTAADGFQLAAAKTWAHGREQPGFVCLDRRLRAAARSEGLVIEPPSFR